MRSITATKTNNVTSRTSESLTTSTQQQRVTTGQSGRVNGGRGRRRSAGVRGVSDQGVACQSELAGRRCRALTGYSAAIALRSDTLPQTKRNYCKLSQKHRQKKSRKIETISDLPNATIESDTRHRSRSSWKRSYYQMTSSDVT